MTTRILSRTCHWEDLYSCPMVSVVILNHEANSPYNSKFTGQVTSASDYQARIYRKYTNGFKTCRRKWDVMLILLFIPKFEFG